MKVWSKLKTKLISFDSKREFDDKNHLNYIYEKSLNLSLDVLKM